MSERTCTAHPVEPNEAEVVIQGGLTYRMLRCPECGRPRGLRWVRRAEQSERLTIEEQRLVRQVIREMVEAGELEETFASDGSPRYRLV